MMCNDLWLKRIKKEFDSLWSCTVLGDTLKLTVPYVTLYNEFVDLYVTKRDNKYIVADGGQLNDFLIELKSKDNKLLNDCISLYMKEYNIHKTLGDQRLMYFKKTTDEFYLGTSVLHMSEFIKSVYSLIKIDSHQKEDKEVDTESDIFRKDATKFVNDIYGSHDNYQVSFNQRINNIKVSCEINSLKGKNLLQFITGGSEYYYRSFINNTSADFSVLNSNSAINEKIVLLDDRSDVYKKNKEQLDVYILEMASNLTRQPIFWSEKNKLTEYIPL